MKETYLIRIFLGNEQMSTATAFNEENMRRVVKDTDKGMIDKGYRRVSYLRTRIDKKHITCVTVTYQRV